ncbi:hypothetical protein ACGRHY_00235 [Streptomyces sp. HK10]
MDAFAAEGTTVERAPADNAWAYASTTRQQTRHEPGISTRWTRL